MIAASDSLSLILVGTIETDPRLVSEGRSRHGRAIQLLRTELEHTSPSCDDAVLGTVDMLAMCQLWAPISSNDWRTHVRGLCTLLSLLGPRSCNTPFQASLLHYFRQVDVCEVYTESKALHLRRRCLDRCSRDAGSGWSCRSRQPCDAYSCGIRGCGVCCCVKQNFARSNRCHESTHGSRRGVKQLAFLMLRAETIESPTSLWNVSPFSRYQGTYDSVKDVFTPVFDWPAKAAGIAHPYYWSCLLLVRYALVNVGRHEKLQTFDAPWFVQRAYEAADSRYQVLPYFLQVFSDSVGGVFFIGGPLRIATDFQMEQGCQREIRKLEWCGVGDDEVESGRLKFTVSHRLPLFFRAFAGMMAVQ
ncbi:hypothetical protein BAUCODRAFT_121593 [Baudoinia panamericana UAMH 10762]|uniref:Uncharacterized protein n=1 Tax=Baudoinia panamericana (strain UAMH 10762) TaxID=717646 RepID=M2LRK5_BAUPA|nr:uncharacterized protein BAUCODRAFT_121593 [Baudoinia panamericana UAMH 10762]EMC97082.1 hypothetical protein BAUCODRAFT_121593 [Baudoinia panamericana UAMH 10762]